MENKPLKILAIDDYQDNLIVLRAVLQDTLPGARLITALNGPRGIELALAEDPDVILLDIIMPGMDGFTVCRKLKVDERLRHIPVIFLTGLKGDMDNRMLALEVGAEGFLSKPLDEIELVVQIRAMAKIKAASHILRLEADQLARLVDERTRDLARSENRFRRLIESSNDMIFCLDREGVFVTAGGARLSQFGLTPEGIIGSTLYNLFPKDEAEYYHKKHLEVFEGGEVITYEQTFTFAGITRTDLVTVYPIKDESGAVELVGVIGRDITERKQAEMKLIEQMDELRRWHSITLGREDRIIDLKREVNSLLRAAGKPPHYASVESGQTNP